MKKYSLLLISIFAFILSSSCNRSEYEVSDHPNAPFQRMWAMRACSNVFDIKDESPMEWGQKVVDTLKKRNFTIEENHMGYIKQKPFIGCGNCLRTGDYLDVKVPENQREDLKKLGFGDN